MDNFLKSLQDVFISRVKNMLLLNFFIAWSIWNYDIVMTIVFDEMKTQEKITFIQNLDFSFINWFLIPLAFTAIYIYIIPLLNLWIVIPYNRFVDKRIKEHKNKTLIEHYEKLDEVERIRLEKTEFLKDQMKIEYEKAELEIQKNKNVETEREKNLKREQLELEQKENEELEKSNDLKREAIELSKQENESLKKELETLKNEIKNKKDELTNIKKDLELERKLKKQPTSFSEIFTSPFEQVDKTTLENLNKGLAGINLTELEKQKNKSIYNSGIIPRFDLENAYNTTNIAKDKSKHSVERAYNQINPSFDLSDDK